MDLVEVQVLAAQLGTVKGTVSQRVASDTIPVADHDKNNYPLFDATAVRAACTRTLTR